MAEIYWHGNEGNDTADQANKGDWAYDSGSPYTTSNWRSVADGTGVAKPADGDIIYFDSRAYYDSTNSRYCSVDDEGTAAETGTPDLDGIYVSSDYDGDIGSATEYIHLHMTGGDFVYEGAGTAYIMLSNGATTNATLDRTVVNTTGTLYIDSLENDVTYLGKWDKVYVLAGSLYANDDVSTEGAFIEELWVFGGTVTADHNCYDKTGTATTNGATIYQYGGTVYWDSMINQITMTGGNFYWGTSANTDADNSDCGYLYMYGGGTFNWRVHDTATSILNDFRIYGSGCTLDASSSVHGDVPKQLGTGAASAMELWEGTAKFNNGNNNISFATGWTIANYGGTLYAPNREEVSW